MKKYIFVALAAICLSVLFSCSSRVPVVNNKDTYTIDMADNIDTKETYQIDMCLLMKQILIQKLLQIQ